LDKTISHFAYVNFLLVEKLNFRAQEFFRDSFTSLTRTTNTHVVILGSRRRPLEHNSNTLRSHASLKWWERW